jgi:hypothetical protein
MAKNMSKRPRNREIQETRNGFVKMPKQLAYQGDLITKRLTHNDSYSTTNAVLTLQTISTSNVESDPATEWSSFAARYQQYRVKALSVTVYMLDPVGYAATPFVFSDYIGTATPSSATQILSDERSVIRAPGGQQGSTMFVYETDWSRNPNAKLWNPTSAAVPSANVYGIAFASHPLASATTGGSAVLHFITTTAWLVEFRGSQ